MASSANPIKEIHCESVDPADRWCLLQQQNETMKRSFLEVKKHDLYDNDRTQLPAPCEASSALVDSQAHRAVSIPPDPAFLRFREIAVHREDRRCIELKSGSGQGFHLVIRIGALLLAIGLGQLGKSLYQHFDRRNELTGQAAISAVVERIIAAESNGDPNLKDRHSSAAGPGQFLDDTWLELIRQYRPDLTKNRNERETLELRREPKLAHEITTRFVERNAAILRRRGLPVTATAIYLAHFAGPAGAVAILSSSENADVALVMASADATGRTTRDQLIKANPFLEHFTVADLKVWADRKMRGSDPRPTNVRTAR
jgi:hypothetical protein